MMPAVGNAGRLGKFELRHANHLRIGPAATNADPMIFQQLDGDVGVGQQLHVVVQLAGGDGAGAFFLHFGDARGAQAQIQIGRGEGKLVARRPRTNSWKGSEWWSCVRPLPEWPSVRAASSNLLTVISIVVVPTDAISFYRHNAISRQRASSLNTSLIPKEKP